MPCFCLLVCVCVPVTLLPIRGSALSFNGTLARLGGSNHCKLISPAAPRLCARQGTINAAAVVGLLHFPCRASRTGHSSKRANPVSWARARIIVNQLARTGFCVLSLCLPLSMPPIVRVFGLVSAPLLIAPSHCAQVWIASGYCDGVRVCRALLLARL